MKQNLYSSNKSTYIQFSSNGKIIFTNKLLKNSSLDKNNNFLVKDEIGFRLLSLFNNNNLKYSTLQYLFNKNRYFENIDKKSNKYFIQQTIELALESGIK
jgi:hypothetical protein